MHVFLLFQLIVYLIIIWETIGIPSTCFIRPSSSSSLQQQQQEEEEEQQQQVATVHFTEISKLANLNQKKKQSTIRTSPNCLFPMYDNSLFTSISITEKELENLNSVSTNAGMVLNFRGNHLYKNVGNRRFVDKTDVAGVRESGWGWGSFFFDADNDGDLDILNGNGLDDPETTDDDWAAKQKIRLYINQGEEEQFKMIDEAEARGIADEGENRGIMTFDFDQDGDLDVLVINHGETPKLYRNDGGNYYDYIRIKALESSGRPSIGARIEIKINIGSKMIVKEVGNSAAYLSQSESIVHVGLGTIELENIYEIKVIWPPRWHNEAVSIARFRNVQTRQTLVTKRAGFGVFNVTIDGNTLIDNKCFFGRPI